MPIITLSDGQTALIDDEDRDLLAHRWWPSCSGHGHVYPQRSAPKTDGRYRKKHMHREIGERIHGGPIPKGWVVDHRDGNTLDCRRANLRVVTHTQNTWNQTRPSRRSATGIVGVRLHRNRWQAYICEGRKMRTLGSFDTAEQARAARLAAERERELAIAA